MTALLLRAAIAALSFACVVPTQVTHVDLVDADHLMVTYQDGRVLVASPDAFALSGSTVTIIPGSMVTTIDPTGLKLHSSFKGPDGGTHDVDTDCGKMTYQDCIIEHSKAYKFMVAAFGIQKAEAEPKK